MSETTAIQWTDATFNPWWGCEKVSPGCANCYAERDAKRYGHDVWGPSPRRYFGDKHWREPVRWNREAEASGVRRRVFCASMADVFEDRRDLDAERARLFTLVEETPSLDWLLLTKRPERVASLVPGSWIKEIFPENVWMGTSVESPDYLVRVEALIEIPAFLHFVSYEPALASVDFSPYLRDPGAKLDWIIVGGESGQKARPFDVEWARGVISASRDRCAVFVKQLGAVVSWNGCQGGYGRGPSNVWPTTDGVIEDSKMPGQWRKYLADRKGGDPSEWPVDLRVREFPRSPALTVGRLFP